VPLVFLTYLNPVFRCGYDTFFSRCADAGVDGIIVPDLPFEECCEVREALASRDVDLISLIAPTSESRIKEIASNAGGFLYIVSSMGVTGVRGEITTDLASIMASVRAVTDLPAAIGFGIHSPAQAKEMAQIADGVIVGSAIVKIAAEYGAGAGEHIYRYVQEMKSALKF
jgi:tryptophan synthase alpha chain